MRYKSIPNTDLSPSVLCLGALPFGSGTSEAASHAMLDRFVVEGGNFIDTALVYGEWVPNGRGASEKTVGRWVKARGNRHQVIIGTKGAHPRLSAMNVPRLSREEIESDLAESLRNLQTDYIDLYWLHRDDPARPVEEIINTLNDQVQAGKIRYFGCSNWRLGRIQQAQQNARIRGVQGFAGNQIMWSLAVPNSEALRDPTMVVMDGIMRHYHLESGMAAMAYNSQARGFFTKLQQSRLEELSEDLRSVYQSEENQRRLKRLLEVSRELSLPVNVLALAYLTSQPFPTFALAGSSNMSQLVENLRAGDVMLEPSIVGYLETGR